LNYISINLLSINSVTLILLPVRPRVLPVLLQSFDIVLYDILCFRTLTSADFVFSFTPPSCTCEKGGVRPRNLPCEPSPQERKTVVLPRRYDVTFPFCRTSFHNIGRHHKRYGRRSNRHRCTKARTEMRNFSCKTSVGRGAKWDENPIC